MRRNLQAEILLWAEDKGLKQPGKPEAEFVLPKEITKLDLDKLGDLYWECGRWVDYLKTEITKVETALGQLKAEERKKWAKLFKEAKNRLPRTGKGTDGGKEAIEAEILSDPEYAQLMDDIEAERGKKNYAEAIYESLRRGANQISREYARRNIKIAAAFTSNEQNQEFD